MVDFGGLAGKAKDFVGKHGDQVDEAVDKAAHVVDERTGSKHSEKISGGADKLKDAVGKAGGRDTPTDAPGAPGKPVAEPDPGAEAQPGSEPVAEPDPDGPAGSR